MSGMFRVREKKTGRERAVYAVMGAMFLFYEDGHWVTDIVEGYEPVEE